MKRPAATSVAPQDLAAEEALLGALLLAGGHGLDTSTATVERVRATGLRAGDFFRASHARVYEAIATVSQRGEPPQALVVVRELERRELLDSVGGRVRVHELAALAPAIGNAVYWAQLIISAARRRNQHELGLEIIAAAVDGGLDANMELRAKLATLLAPDGERPARDGVQARAASEFEREPVCWVVPGRVPTAALTLLVGDPGLGKSLYTCGLAAELSRAGDSVLMVTAEDALAAVVRPRLEAAEAVLDRVRLVSVRRDGVEDGLRLPDDVADLELRVRQYSARLVVIDPLDAHLPDGINSWRSSDIRRALAPLAQLAESCACAVLVVAHLNKGGGREPLYRVSGSIAVPAAARSALLLARDPDDPDPERGLRRVLAHIKCNLAPLAESQSYAVESIRLPATDGTPDVETARLTLLGSSSRTGSELLAPTADDEERSRLTDAQAFLAAELAEGPQLSREVIRRARQLGIADRTLERARKALGVRAIPPARPGEPWQLILPETAATESAIRDRQIGAHTDGALVQTGTHPQETAVSVGESAYSAQLALSAASTAEEGAG